MRSKLLHSGLWDSVDSQTSGFEGTTRRPVGLGVRTDRHVDYMKNCS